MKIIIDKHARNTYIIASTNPLLKSHEEGIIRAVHQYLESQLREKVTIVPQCGDIGLTLCLTDQSSRNV